MILAELGMTSRKSIVPKDIEIRFHRTEFRPFMGTFPSHKRHERRY